MPLERLKLTIQMIRAEENDVKLDGVSMFIPNQGGDEDEE